MIRLLITGNSHVAAIKGGWDRIAGDYAGRVAVEFFAASAAHWRHLVFDGSRYGALGPDVSQDVLDVVIKINGRTHVDLAEYHHVLLVGGAGNGKFEQVARVTGAYDIDGLTARGKPQRLSWAAFIATLDGQSPGLRRWSKAAPGRVSVMTSPRTLETVLVPDTTSQRNDPLCGMDLPDADIRRILDAYDACRAAEIRAHGLGVIATPAEVLGPSGLTAARFKAGAVQLGKSKEQPEEDLQHMNADYGAIVLRDFLDRLLAGQEEPLSA